MVVVIDYNTGNLRSVSNALNRLGAEHIITSDKDIILSAEKVILPGVGEASSAMCELKSRGLDCIIPTLTQPVLGICIGMQLMCRNSEEGSTECMGIFNAEVKKMVSSKVKIPHMGWNQISGLKTPLFDSIIDDSYLYFVHSYAANVCEHTIATAVHDVTFSAALAKDNFFGVQFHPEKSGETGSRLIKNFLCL